MSAGLRLILFALPLILFLLWGAVYEPAPRPQTQDDDTLAMLPPLPDWAEASLPDFSAYTDTNERKQAFFSFLYPRIVLANTRVLLMRQHLMELAGRETLTPEDEQWLARQAERLRANGELGSNEMFESLARRLDVVPPSLVLAQAANESAWGTSRFALQGNNLFGQWCFTQGCGIVPGSRVEGATHEVASFSSPYQSIRSYVQNLNRHMTYTPLRETRERLRSDGADPGGRALATGLVGYSERGQEYVEEIRAMISFNNLAFYDQQYSDTVGEAGRTPELVDLATANEDNLLPEEESDAE